MKNKHTSGHPIVLYEKTTAIASIHLPLNWLKNYNISFDDTSLQIDRNETIHNVNLHNISLRIFMDIGLKNMKMITTFCFCFYFLVWRRWSTICYAICYAISTYLLSRGKSGLTWKIFGYSLLLVTYIWLYTYCITYIFPHNLYKILLVEYNTGFFMR